MLKGRVFHGKCYTPGFWEEFQPLGFEKVMNFADNK